MTRHQHRHSGQVEYERLLHARCRRRLQTHSRHLRRCRTARQQQIRQQFPLLSDTDFHFRSARVFRQSCLATVGPHLTQRGRSILGCSLAQSAGAVANDARNQVIRSATKIADSTGTVCVSGEAGFELGELSHEVEIGWDKRSTVLEVVVCLIEGQSTSVHQICYADGCWTADAGATVYQNFTTRITNTLCKSHIISFVDKNSGLYLSDFHWGGQSFNWLWATIAGM